VGTPAEKMINNENHEDLAAAAAQQVAQQVRLLPLPVTLRR
jgi:hypothetical protein